MSPVRIAFVAHHGSIHTRRWAAHFAAAGHDVHVVTCGDGAVAHPGYTVHDLGPLTVGKATYFLRLRAARQTLSRIDPDLVHAHYLTSYGLLGLASGRRPFVATAHGSDLLISPRNPVLRQIVRRVLQGAQLVTVPSEQMKAVVHELAGRDQHVEVFQYGVDTQRLASLAATAHAARTSPARVRFASARDLLRIYRFDVILEALALLDTAELDWEYELFGAGPEGEKLQAQARQLGIESRVAFPGERPSEEVERGFARADVYLSTAESDGVSIALLEALALGPIPVLSNIPANRNWVEDGVNGMLTPIDPQSVATAIRQALNLDRDVVRAMNLSLVAERADLETNLSRLDRQLTELVDSTRA
jgi:L-malate glycosyltransferase